ncbi:MAG: hypothetical protein A2787_05055 [Omnitrophica WOR_2 bacterium RIFCSPHIGHO2_01_FULL_48_9]|nr:MAG: hypothetical protein A3D10_06470 [Omnitrophica WOR_2 bacterium RIFCSPHIGHO2_02_FULL_48_11]OGX33983.1 MAG: hypothetical protein A2787_05055 [Omnitrophica WOR_2 bacterium RIFCSPHIGHO2_01_FULL_48_9]
MKVKAEFSLFFVFICLMSAGCQAINKGAQEVGKPIGKIMNVPQAVADGAVEGMEPEKQKGSQDNPFNR